MFDCRKFGLLLLEIYGYSKVCVGWDVSFKNSVYEINVVNGFVMW